MHREHSDVLTFFVKQREMAPGVPAREAIERLRYQVAQNGVRGIRSLASAFRRMDWNGEHRCMFTPAAVAAPQRHTARCAAHCLVAGRSVWGTRLRGVQERRHVHGAEAER